jgi:hypothetical protein
VFVVPVTEAANCCVAPAAMDALAGVTATAITGGAVPVPLRAIIAEPFVEELLFMVNWPVAAPTAVGSNSRFSVVCWLGFNVAGKAAPCNVNPVPVSVAALIVIGTVPEEVKVTDWVAGVLITTSPNATLVALMLSARIAAFSCRVKLFITPPALAVIVIACAVATEDIVAVNPALVEFAGTVTVLGTVTAALLLVRFTISPSLGAAAVSVTVHASVPDPVMAPLLHESALNAADPAPVVPVPLRLITGAPVAGELLAIASWPVAAPEAVGLNCTFKPKDPPAAMVTGSSLGLRTEKDWPVRFSFAIWTGA